MDIPISLLSEFTNYDESKQKVKQRFIQILKQYLYDYNVVKNETMLNQKIVSFYENPIEFRKKILQNIEDPIVYARVYFIFSILICDYSIEVKDVLDNIVNSVYTKLDLYPSDQHDNILLCYDIQTKKIINYLKI